MSVHFSLGQVIVRTYRHRGESVYHPLGLVSFGSDCYVFVEGAYMRIFAWASSAANVAMIASYLFLLSVPSLEPAQLVPVNGAFFVLCLLMWLTPKQQRKVPREELVLEGPAPLPVQLQWITFWCATALMFASLVRAFGLPEFMYALAFIPLAIGVVPSLLAIRAP